MKNKEPIDKLFKQRVENFEPVYSEAYWSDMNSRLRKKRFASWRNKIGIIALVVIAAVTTIILLYKSSNENFSAIQSESNIVDPKDAALVTKEAEKPQNPKLDHKTSNHQQIKSFDHSIFAKASVSSTIYESKIINKDKTQTTTHQSTSETKEVRTSSSTGFTEIAQNNNEIILKNIETESLQIDHNASENEQDKSDIEQKYESAFEDEVEEQPEKEEKNKGLDFKMKKKMQELVIPFKNKWSFGVFAYMSAFAFQDDAKGYLASDISSSFISPGLMFYRKLTRNSELQTGVFYSAKSFQLDYNNISTPAFPQQPIYSLYDFKYLSIPIRYSRSIYKSEVWNFSVQTGVTIDQLVKSSVSTSYPSIKTDDSPFMLYNKTFINPTVSIEGFYVLSKHLFIDFVAVARYRGNKGLISTNEQNMNLLKLTNILPEGYLGIKYNF